MHGVNITMQTEQYLPLQAPKRVEFGIFAVMHVEVRFYLMGTYSPKGLAPDFEIAYDS